MRAVVFEAVFIPVPWRALFSHIPWRAPGRKFAMNATAALRLLQGYFGPKQECVWGGGEYYLSFTSGLNFSINLHCTGIFRTEVKSYLLLRKHFLVATNDKTKGGGIIFSSLFSSIRILYGKGNEAFTPLLICQHTREIEERLELVLQHSKRPVSFLI